MWPIWISIALAVADPMPPGAAVLPDSAIDTLLTQCSRGVPEPGEGSWQPTAEQIIALEAALPATLKLQPGVRWEVAAFPTGWTRQYVGIVRGGRRFV